MAIMAHANTHYVVPAMRTSYKRLALLDALPTDVGSYLALIQGQNAARNARIREQCLGIGRALAARGMRAVLLKGAAWLFDGNAAEASDRMMRDIDLLVAPADLDGVVAVLCAAGYRDTSDTFAEVDHFHHAPLLPLPDGETSVELHRDVAHRSALLPPDSVLRGAVEVAPGLALPTPAHRILHKIIHAQIENGEWYSGATATRDLLDLARLLSRPAWEIDWGLILPGTTAGFRRIVRGTVFLTSKTLGCPVPPGLEADAQARWHVWRCLQQRRCPPVAKAYEGLGRLRRALSWERDAYALHLPNRASFSAQLRVNRRRFDRVRSAIKRQSGL